MALNAGIAWKTALLQARITYALQQLATASQQLSVATQQLAADPTDPASQSQFNDAQTRVNDVSSLIQRYQHELDVVKGADRGAAYDLVKGNLQHQIEIEEAHLVRLEAFYGDRQTVDSEVTGAQRRLIEALKEILKALEAEGRPS